MFDYKIIETIHESEAGISSIFKIKHANSDDYYALKVIGPLDDNLSRLMFEREITSLYNLNEYDNIVRIHSHEIANFSGKENMGLIVLEYINGNTLERAMLDVRSPLEKYNLCFYLAEAVKNAHDNSVLHRDIKPSNIMVYNNKVKIIDFGISKIKSTIETGTLYLKGTSNYCAPEVAKGHEATERSDIYSLGAVIFTLLTNAAPKDTFYILETINSASIEFSIKDLLISLLKENPQERPDDLDYIKNCFYDSAQKILRQAVRLTFQIGSVQIDKLKSNHTIQSLPYAKVTAITLPDEFCAPYAIFDESKDIYEFVGNNLCMKCTWNDSTFTVVDIYSLPTDTLIKLKRRFLSFDYTMAFSSSAQSSSNAEIFINQLKNHNQERASDAYKQEQFNKLFDKWNSYLDDCVRNTKKLSPKINYTEYTIEGDLLHFTVDEYINGDVDSLNEATEYSVETKHSISKKPVATVIGTYYNTAVEGDNTIITLKINKKASRNLITSTLRKTHTLFEDYNKKISNYKKQFRAISELEKDNYKSKGIKEIMLTLQVPTTTPLLDSIVYTDARLDEYQREAVKKAIEADSLALIQGPPGTGKTSVIKEIISQLLEKPRSSYVMPKILLVSQSHTAVDNVLEGINSGYRIVRIGNEDKFSKHVAERYSLDQYETLLFNSIEENGQSFLNKKLHDYGLSNSDQLSPANSAHTQLLKIKELQKMWFESKDVRELNYHVVNSALIIAGTCTGYLSNEYIKDLIFDCVIVDEAAKASTPELLLSILNSKKIILVGDHYQLPPFSDSNLSPLANELTTNPEYKLFDLLHNNLPDSHKQTLKCQYRMIKNIGDMISHVFYDDTISTGIEDRYRKHEISKYNDYSIVWNDTSELKDHNEKKEKSGSFSNQTECDIIIKSLSELAGLENANTFDIGVITGYKAQKNLIKKMAINANLMNKFKFLDINTVDAFQGRENDIIFFSTVRTEKSIGFQKEKERVNVAFSRAKKLLIICGDLEFISNFDDEKNKFIYIEDYMLKHPDTCMIVR